MPLTRKKLLTEAMAIMQQTSGGFSMEYIESMELSDYWHVVNEVIKLQEEEAKAFKEATNWKT